MLQKGRSLHIGLNNVDTQAYQVQGYTVPQLAGCLNDASAMQTLAAGQGFITQSLTDGQATSSEVIRLISSYGRELEPGDIFLLTFSGHGGQVPDVNGDEDDGMDETWVLYDRMLIDDELFQLFSQFQAGVRIFMLSDSCHSGTVAKQIVTKAVIDQYRQMSDVMTSSSPNAFRGLVGLGSRDITALHSDKITMRDIRNLKRAAAVSREVRFRGLPTNISQELYLKRQREYDSYQHLAGRPRDADFRPALILISGCQDSQLSQDGDNNGLFTQNLLQAWDNGNFSGDYGRFHSAIASNMPPDQTPNFFTLGDVSEFSPQRPFSVTTQSFDPAGPSPRISVEGSSTRSRADTAPNFVVDTQGAPFYIVEFATELSLFDTANHDADRNSGNFYGTWSESPVFKADNGFYPMPNNVWQSLSAADQIYFRVGTTTAETGYPDYRVSTENDATSGVSLSIT
jgi:hypothetical protein